jgi:broad specificity phosphatase PhoE
MAELEWLAVVRHGESTGNTVAYKAEAAGIELIDIPERDPDVGLSDTGREQAAAVGRWLSSVPMDERPDVAVSSTYRRALQTAEIAAEAMGGLPILRDERLRDRELGILDLLTSHGVRARLPGEAARRERLGKFYYRPPGGESWADVALRLRSVLGDLRRDYADRRVLLFGHEAIVFLLRYVIEGLTEAELMTVVRTSATIGNCSITSWSRDADGVLRPSDFNRVDHLPQQGVEPTREETVDAEPV